MSEKLKPCPFCDGDDIEFIPADIIAGTQYWRIFCYGCGCTQTPISSKEEAIEAWNTRPNPWHTGTPTEEGWYLVAYQHKNKMTYRAVRFFSEKGLDMEFLDSEGGIYYPDIWEAIAWQKIEPCYPTQEMVKGE